MSLETFTAHILDPVLPELIPASFAMRGHTSHDDPLASFSPGLEGNYLADRDPFVEIGFSVHAIADADYLGQWMFLQVCRRTDPNTAFGDWHYGFYYRGGDAPWEVWTLDIVSGAVCPTHAEFGAYVDDHLRRDRKGPS